MSIALFSYITCSLLPCVCRPSFSQPISAKYEHHGGYEYRRERGRSCLTPNYNFTESTAGSPSQIVNGSPKLHSTTSLVLLASSHRTNHAIGYVLISLQKMR